MDALIAHYHEIGLKGRNRDFFEQALVRNLRRALHDTGYKKVTRNYGRVVIDLHPHADTEAIVERAQKVFGVAYLGAGTRVAPDLDEITRVAVEMMTAMPFPSFAVRARRMNSDLDVKSQHINEHVGRAVQEATGAPVNLKHPDATCWIELFDKSGIVYRKRVRGPGGLPVGVSGRLLALLSGGIDSPVAAWRMARRGASVEFVHFHGQPYTDPSSIRQAEELARVLARYQGGADLHLVPLADAQRDIVTHAPSSLRTVLYRRTMLRIAARVAEERGAKALVTGDSLGQVASQTIENIRTADAAVTGTQVLRPLVGMDKQEIIDEARAIGTYEISTRKYQDCCVLFQPRDPATKASLRQCDRAEENLDVEAMVGKALAAREVRSISPAT